VEQFVARHPPPPEEDRPAFHLPLPVILPQRRPEARARGFIRAYAPLLEDCGIDQETFLEFIHDLNVICVPNPLIQTINLAGFATMALPMIAGMIVSGVINKGTMFISEENSRSK
jgi:hypothetical protein